MPTGTSGNTCHTEKPASASQSMKRKAESPIAPRPGRQSDERGNSTPERRLDRTFCNVFTRGA